MANSLSLLEMLQKAIRAERRNKWTDSGVLGGFAKYLLSTVDTLSRRFSVDQPEYRQTFTRLRELAQAYPEYLNRQRQPALEEIANLVNKLQAGLNPADAKATRASDQADGPADRPAERKKTKQEVPSARGNNLPIQFLKTIGPKRAKTLQRLGIFTVEDLLNHFPKRYEDRRNVKKINQVCSGEVETVKARVISQQELKPRRGLKIIKLDLSDGSGTLTAVWFNNPYVLKQLPRGIEVVVTGKVERRFGSTELMVSDYELAGAGDYQPGIVPVYGATENLTSKQIKLLVGYALEHVERLMPEFLPEDVLNRYHFPRRADAYRQIHFPTDFAQKEAARRRLVFEEFVLLQLGIQRVKGKKDEVHGIPMGSPGPLVSRLRKNLPFTLTGAQVRVIREVFRDMARPHPMARLVQGDVGSGKTVVAAMALLLAIESGYQGAMMAPTEILAEQHYLALRQAFQPLGLNVELLTGSRSKREREEVLRRTALGECQVLVGTHALVQETVAFKALGLAVTDEQHRFGVRQRANLQAKGENPHVLIMTATPIPRTLALTVYGDLSLSVIDELPPGRKEIKTCHISEKNRQKLYRFMEQEIAKGRQIYVVCPLVKESEVLDLRAATELAQVIAGRFPHEQVGLLHGRMRKQEKEAVINGFRENQIKIIVSTTVIEVGVNVPNASVMVIESAERFGLAQLHQLRGRVGRGSYQSYCILVGNADNDEIRRRLGIMCATNDGFKIAEEDLKLRGPGEFFGTRQHGLPELKIADIIHDGPLLDEAGALAAKLIEMPGNEQILAEADKKFGAERFVRG